MTVGITVLSDGRFVAEVSGTDLSGSIAGEVSPGLAAMLRGAFAALPRARHALRRADARRSCSSWPACSANRRSSCSRTTGHRTRPRSRSSPPIRPTRVVTAGGSCSAGAWHTDDSYLAVPAKATMLYAHVIPPTGGDTLFADTTAAYEALDATWRAELAGMRVVHTYQSRRNVNAVPTRSASEEAQTPPVEHPLVRTHPETGRRSLYLNPNRMESIVGLDEAASDRLLDRAHRARHAGTLRAPPRVAAA